MSNREVVIVHDEHSVFKPLTLRGNIGFVYKGILYNSLGSLLASIEVDLSIKGLSKREIRNKQQQVLKESIYSLMNDKCYLQKELTKTGDSSIVYMTLNETYWGVNSLGQGLNILGLLLEEIRMELTQIEKNVENSI